MILINYLAANYGVLVKLVYSWLNSEVNFGELNLHRKRKLSDKQFFITEKGKKEFSKLGIDLSQIKRRNKKQLL